MADSPAVGIGFPGHRAPAVGFEAPFEMLSACHERVERMLDLLAKLRTHLIEKGWDTQAATASADVMRYFDLAAPQHHLDEEMHVFPAVLALNNARLNLLVFRLKEDHREMQRLWTCVRETLASVTQSDAQRWTGFSVEDKTDMDAFMSIYKDHIHGEEIEIYPAARKSLDGEQLQSMSREMMRRRGHDGS